MAQVKMTQAERLARIEAVQEERFKTLFEQLERNNPHPLVNSAIDKIDALDERVVRRFSELDKALDTRFEKVTTSLFAKHGQLAEEHAQLKAAHDAEAQKLATYTAWTKGAVAAGSAFAAIIGAVMATIWKHVATHII